MRPLCPRCKRRPRKAHHNSKWCHPCAEALKRQPKGTLTAAQRTFAVRHSGDMLVRDIAKRLGTSISNVKRSCRGVRFHAHNGKYKERPELVRQVLDYYFEHGKPETEKAFPGVSVKSIVDRPEYYGVKRIYRQIRWTDDQLIEVARMGGIVSYTGQARYFNRPRANEGAIKSVWTKRFGLAGGGIHGMSDWMARHLVEDECPRLVTRVWETRRDNNEFARKLCLWVDMERHLRPETPQFIGDAIRQMAQFQRWIFKTKDPKRVIVRMIEEREV